MDGGTAMVVRCCPRQSGWGETAAGDKDVWKCRMQRRILQCSFSLFCGTEELTYTRQALPLPLISARRALYHSVTFLALILSLTDDFHTSNTLEFIPPSWKRLLWQFWFAECVRRVSNISLSSESIDFQIIFFKPSQKEMYLKCNF